MNRSTLRSLCAALIAAWPSIAHADTDVATAQELFDQAKALAKTGDYATACPKFEESQRVAPGIGTEYNLADCYEHVGRLASAWAAFVEVANNLRAAHETDRANVARSRASALQPRLVRIKVSVSPESRVPDLEVRRDGALIGQAQWGIALPVDPGQHVFRASVPGRPRWETTVTISEEGTTAVVEVPKLSAATVVSVPPPVPEIRPKLQPPIVVMPAVGRDGVRERWAGIALVGAGAIGLGLGTVFGLQAISKHDQYRSHCTGDVCDASGVTLHDDASRAGTMSTIAFGVGGAAVIGGAILWLTAPSRAASRTGSLEFLPRVGLGSGELVVRSAW